MEGAPATVPATATAISSSATNANHTTETLAAAAADNEAELKAQRKKEEREREKQKKMEKFLAKKDKQTTTTTSTADTGGEAAAATKPATKPAKQQHAVKETISYENVFRETPAGDKKLLPEEMPSAYSPKYVEAAWYQWWEKQGFFTPEYTNPPLQELRRCETDEKKKKFIMVIPPPNVTGSLHIGHGLSNAVEDVLTRWNRMCGRETLWVPGCDHAGIATQVVVEKRLAREQKKSRHDIGREAFVNEVWKWKNEKGDEIYNQLRRLGVSVDWNRARFTMDPSMSRAVTEAFCRWHEQGVIYRDVRLINWSCTLRSAISDIEVDKRELTGRTLLAVPSYADKVEFGTLTLFAYKIEDAEDDEIIVATTRVETMLGDTAIAVHPRDDRYRRFHGKFARHPFIEDRRLPIVCDEFVEMNFGTGAVKITPAHDANDYEVGKRYKLPFITIFDDNGLMLDNCGQFSRMKRFDARRKVAEALTALGLLREKRDHPMIVPICSRSKDIVEPMIKDQWFVNCQDLARQACDVVRNGSLRLLPSSSSAQHEKTWFAWMENARDWCISRQLWWGHRIPAYQVRVKNNTSTATSANQWVSGRTREEALQKAVNIFGVANADQLVAEQDEDVLDTWFSSGLFPFAVFNWPDNTEDLQKYYPTSVLETGHDILFFWVARMVMMGLSFTGQLPFAEVYLHAMVRDAHGRKMSKSLGNVIDPLDVIQGITLEQLHKQLDANSNLESGEIERAKKGQKADFPNGIPECGTDALRFALCAYTSQPRDINLDVLRVQGYRFFSNKLWNAMRFAIMQLQQGGNRHQFQPMPNTKSFATEKLLPFDAWILSRASFAVDECNAGFEQYDLSQATTACYNFWLYDLCDVYLECLKPILSSASSLLSSSSSGGTDVQGQQQQQQQEKFIDSRQILYTVLDIGLRLIAPLMPFITEELYQRLPRRQPQIDPPSICVTPYPGRLKEYSSWRNEKIEQQVSTFMDVVRAIRSLRADYDGLAAPTAAAAAASAADAQQQQQQPQSENRKVKTAVYIECHASEVRQLLAPLVTPYLQSLSNSGAITLVGGGEGADGDGGGSGDSTKIPAKCAQLNVGNAFSVHLELGNVDWDREIARATERMQKLDVESEKLKKTLATPGYAEKVPVSVREAQQEKLTAQMAEKDRVKFTVDKLEQFKRMA